MAEFVENHCRRLVEATFAQINFNNLVFYKAEIQKANAVTGIVNVHVVEPRPALSGRKPVSLLSLEAVYKEHQFSGTMYPEHICAKENTYVTKVTFSGGGGSTYCLWCQGESMAQTLETILAMLVGSMRNALAPGSAKFHANVADFHEVCYCQVSAADLTMSGLNALPCVADNVNRSSERTASLQ
ncbi:hypothetical protein ECG_01826 [Echinococcus granulosus]|nr:hypothetical protein ECG_01826 [Echinococcus granulosus]